MFRLRKTLRWLTAVYVAVLLPFCCCYTPASARVPVSPEPLQDQAEPGHDHDHHGAAGTGHHREPHDLPGHQAPSGNDHPCDPGSHDHEGECDCGCSSGPAAFTLDAPPATHLTLTAAGAFVPIIDSFPFGQVSMIQAAAPCNQPNTSLLQLHCALIV